MPEKIYQIYYVTKCGCRVTKENTKRIRSHENTNLIVCKDHLGKILYRERECIECHKIYRLNMRGPGGFRCPDCANEEKKRRRKKIKQKKNKTKGNPKKTKYQKFVIDDRGDYCRSCWKCYKNGMLHCADCKDFFPIIKGVDPGKGPKWTLKD